MAPSSPWPDRAAAHCSDRGRFDRLQAVSDRLDRHADTFDVLEVNQLSQGHLLNLLARRVRDLEARLQEATA